MQYLEKLVHSGGVVALDSAKSAPPQLLSVLSESLPSLYRCAHRILGNTADAEDAVQDALLAAFKYSNQFRGEAQYSTWVTTIVINCARMHLRRRSRHTHVSLESRVGEEQGYPLSDSLVDERPNPEDECHKSTLNARLMKSAARLSPVLRRTFHLRYVDQLSVIETARVLGLPIGTVKAQTARARAKLQELVRQVVHTRSRSRRRRR